MNTAHTNANTNSKRVSSANSVASGRLSVENQTETGCHYVTVMIKVYIKRRIKEKKWLKNDNTKVMEC